jgi:hypothetical protein
MQLYPKETLRMGSRLQGSGLLIQRLWMARLSLVNCIITSNEDNVENFDEGLNDTQGWGGHGTIE